MLYIIIYTCNSKFSNVKFIGTTKNIKNHQFKKLVIFESKQN